MSEYTNLRTSIEAAEAHDALRARTGELSARLEKCRATNARLIALAPLLPKLAEALRRCADELEESVEFEGRLGSFVSAAKKARAILAEYDEAQKEEG